MRDLSKSDLCLMLDIIHKLPKCTTKADFHQVVDHLKGLIDFTHIRSLFCTINCTNAKNSSDLNMISTFPQEWESHYSEQNYLQQDNVVYVAFTRQGLIQWEDCQDLPIFSEKKNQQSRQILEAARAYGLRQGWIYSMPSRKSGEFTIISFASENLSSDKHTNKILNYISPHIGLAVKRIATQQIETYPRLTPRETEVLSWTAAGKTAWEISEILKVSRRTVEFHTGNVLRKLDAINSQQAIAIAITRKIISI